MKDPARRPITFAFNGGPGSASIWLHMGALGPRRVVVSDGHYAPPPPVQLVDNEYSILDVTDLVMIDPVGTGFSKPVGDAKGEDFWGVDQDIESVGDFIRRYTTENGRWGSPKYVLGESYGGVRGAGLARHLQSKLGMNLNGLILVSPYFGQVSGNDGMGIDLPHVLYVSTFAATAWYYDAIPNKPASLETFISEVERFAIEEYAPALLKGYAIPAEEKQAVARQARGLHRHERGVLAEGGPARRPRAVPAGAAARPRPHRRPHRLALLGPVAERAERQDGLRPVLPRGRAGVHGGLPRLPALGAEVRRAGRVRRLRRALRQVGLAPRAAGHRGRRERPGAGDQPLPDLALAMTMNPGLHLLVEQGYYDLATPTHALKYNLNQLRLTPETRGRIRVNYHGAGHMMYIHEESGRAFRENLVGFIRDTDRL